MTENLARLEALALELYSPASSPKVRDSARLSLSPVASSPDSLLHCHALLQRSSSPEALLFACNALHELVSKYFRKLSISDVELLHNSVILMLSSPSSQPSFVRSSAIRLLCRLTKLAWLRNNQHREVFEKSIVPILTQQPHLGLQILDELIVEFFTNTTAIPLIDNRRAASNFRLSYLHEIACIASNMVPVFNVRTYAIKVLCRALVANSTVFLPEESLEDNGSLMVSDKWAETIVNSRTVNGLVELSAETPDAIEAIAILARVRRSLWSSTERENWIRSLMHATQTLASRAASNISSVQSQVFFAQLLMNLKMTFQLSDFLLISEAQKWFSDMGDITILLWSTSMEGQSTLSLLRFWSGVARARRNPPTCAAENEVDRQIVHLALKFLELKCEAHYYANAEDQSNAEEELDCLAIMFHHDCNSTLTAFHNQFDKALHNHAFQCLSWLSAFGTRIVSHQRTRSGDLRGKLDASITIRMLRILEEPLLQRIGSIQVQVVFFLDEIRHHYFTDGNNVFSENQQKSISAFYSHLSDMSSRIMSMEALVALLLPALGNIIGAFGASSVPEDQLVAEEASELIIAITTATSCQSILRYNSLSELLTSLTEKAASRMLRTKLAACLCHSLINSRPENVDDETFIITQCTRLFDGRLKELFSCQNSNDLRRVSDAEITALIGDMTGMAHATQANAKFAIFWMYLEPYMSILGSIMGVFHSGSFRRAILDFLGALTKHNSCNPFSPVSSDGLRLFKSSAPILQFFSDLFLQNFEAGQQFTISVNTLSSHEAGSASPRGKSSLNDEDCYESLESYFDIVAGVLSGSWVQTGAMKLYGDMTAFNLISQALAVLIRGAVCFSDLISIHGTKRAAVQLLTILCDFYKEQVSMQLNSNERNCLFMNLLSLTLNKKDLIAMDCLSSLLTIPDFISENDACHVFEMLLDAAFFEEVDLDRFSSMLFPLIIRQPGGCLASYRKRLLEANPSCQIAVVDSFNELARDLHPRMSNSKMHVASFVQNIVKTRTLLHSSGIYTAPSFRI